MFSFDLQLFNDSLALVYTADDGKVTLDFGKLNEDLSEYDRKTYSITNGIDDRVYGTIEFNFGDKKLTVKPDASYPIAAVVSSKNIHWWNGAELYICIDNSNYLKESVNCKIYYDSMQYLCFVYPGHREIRVTGSKKNTSYEVTYHHDDNNCWVEPARNEKIMLQGGAYAVLSNGAKVKNASTPRQYELTADNDGNICVSDGSADLEKDAFVEFVERASVVISGTKYTTTETGATIGNRNGTAQLTKGEVKLDTGQSIVMDKDTTAIINGVSYTAAGTGATIANKDNKAQLTAGTVTVEAGKSIDIGGKSYTATENGATIGNSNGTARLTEGAVKLDKGGSIYAGGVMYNVTSAEGEEGCTVAADGSISNLAEGTRLTVVQNGEEYDCLVSGGEFEVTKDGVTKSCSLSDGDSLAGSALEKVLGEVQEELSNPDPSKPQTIKTTPGQTKTPEKFDPKKDTIKISQASGALEADKLILTEDGRMTYGDSFADGLASNGVVDLSKGERGKSYYTARLVDKDGKNPQLAAWSGTQSATVDMRQETKGVIMKDGGNGKKDTFLGGKGKDDITLGTEDVAAGGKGNDNITMGKDASGAAVALKDGDGHDKVEGFRFGFGEEANAVSLWDGQSMSGVSVDSSGRLKVGTATLEFAGTDLKNSGQTDLLLKDSHGTHKAAVGTSLTAEGELADIYYGTGKEAEADFSNSGESGLVIDLNNSSSYGKTTASVYNVQKVKGSENADNTMVGQDGKNNTLIAGDGGSNRLYGGKGGMDRMVGSSTSEDTFYFGADSGRDEIENFGEEDAIGLLGGSLSEAAFDASGRLKLGWQDEKGNSSRLTFTEDMKDKVISYDLGSGLHGAKFGEKLTVTDDTADFVDYYSSGSKEGDGELDLSGGSDKKIWLDGSHGAVFDGFNKIDATAATGDMELAGGDKGDSILGGQGESSLWGGSGGNDYLTGGSGYNEFYFGRGEGHDVITDSNNGDKVMLYNVALEDLDLARTGMDDSGNMVIRLLDGSSLTIRNYGAQGASTFQLADSTWNYDRASGAWSRE